MVWFVFGYDWGALRGLPVLFVYGGGLVFSYATGHLDVAVFGFGHKLVAG